MRSSSIVSGIILTMFCAVAMGATKWRIVGSEDGTQAVAVGRVNGKTVQWPLYLAGNQVYYMSGGQPRVAPPGVTTALRAAYNASFENDADYGEMQEAVQAFASGRAPARQSAPELADDEGMSVVNSDDEGVEDVEVSAPKRKPKKTKAKAEATDESEDSEDIDEPKVAKKTKKASTEKSDGPVTLPIEGEMVCTTPKSKPLTVKVDVKESKDKKIRLVMTGKFDVETSLKKDEGGALRGDAEEIDSYDFRFRNDKKRGLVLNMARNDRNFTCIMNDGKKDSKAKPRNILDLFTQKASGKETASSSSWQKRMSHSEAAANGCRTCVVQPRVGIIQPRVWGNTSGYGTYD